MAEKNQPQVFGEGAFASITVKDTDDLYAGEDPTAVAVDEKGTPVADKPQEQVGDRPEWLPEKFKSPEELAKAYSELEKQFGQRGQTKGDEENPVDSLRLSKTEAEEQAREAADKAGIDYDALATEYMEKGELSEQTLLSLEKEGMPRQVVDRYLRGLEAEAKQVISRAADLVGGEDTLRDMLQWAKANLDEDQKQFFDNAWQSGSEARLKLAVLGVKAQYEAAVGKQANLVRVEQAATTAGAQPFGSMDELVEAMMDPRYRTNSRYRSEVERRIAVSKLM